MTSDGKALGSALEALMDAVQGVIDSITEYPVNADAHVDLNEIARVLEESLEDVDAAIRSDPGRFPGRKEKEADS